jgi:hypothetical protein
MRDGGGCYLKRVSRMSYVGITKLAGSLCFSGQGILLR